MAATAPHRPTPLARHVAGYWPTAPAPIASPAMHSRLMIAALAGTALLLTGCGSNEPTAPTGAPAPVVPTSAPAQAAPGPDILTADEVPAEGRTAYLEGLSAIDLGLTVNEDRAIGRATNICLDIERGQDETTVYRKSGWRDQSPDGRATDSSTSAAPAM